MPAAKKPAPAKRLSQPRQERTERVVTMPDGQRMRSTLAQMQKARSQPLISPQQPRPAVLQLPRTPPGMGHQAPKPRPKFRRPTLRR